MEHSATKTLSANSWEDKKRMSKRDPVKFFASVNTEDDNSVDFLRAFWEGFIAGGAAGLAAEAALYPIDTIKTRLQAAHGEGKIILKGLYSGLAGNLIGILPASAIYVGIYEPIKQKLLRAIPENLSAFAHLDFIQTAGAIGGAASSLVRVPTEVVKQRMQTGQFHSAPDSVRLIITKEGFGGLYAGYGSFLLRDLPFDAVQFCIYEQLLMGYKLAARRDLKDPEIAILVHLLDWLNYEPATGYAIVSTYEGTKSDTWAYFLDFETPLVGTIIGAIAGALTNPLDVVKTRLMVQGSANHYKSSFDCVRTIIKEEGSHALLKGIGPRVIWLGIGGSIFFGVLEKTKQVLYQRRRDAETSLSFKQS